MTDWPRIMTDVDDDKPATDDDDVEYCERCGKADLKEHLENHCSQRRCEDCRPLCQACEEAPVFEPGEFCEICAMGALGVEI